jgi:cytosine/adenosine deaminase-related metal-dependent hydrolase
MSGAFAIAGATILAGTGMEAIRGGFAVIHSGRIASIGEGAPPRDIPTVLDARGAILAPAFINAHTHVSDVIAKEAAFGLPHWQAVMPPDGVRHVALRSTSSAALESGMADVLNHMIAAGTSTFCDFREGGLAGVRLLNGAARGLPIRAVALGRFASFPPQSEAELQANRAGLSEPRRAEVDEILREAGGFSCVTANDLTDHALSELHDRVRMTSRLLAIHVAESPEYRSISLSRTGAGDVERVLRFLRPDFVVHLTDAAPEELDRLAASGMPAVVCPRIQGVMGLGVPRFDLMMERGMTVALGTDNLFLCSPDMLREVEYSSRVIRALRKDPRFPTAVQMLQMITINAAKVLGRDAEIGSIEVGKRADIVAFDSTSLNLRPVRDPVATLVNRAESRDIMAVFHEGALVRGGFESGALD